MLSGKELAAALREAMRKKTVGPSEVAREFRVTQPSVSGWLIDGRIAKKHIPKLLSYFADVVGPDHWGLPITKREFDMLLSFRELAEPAQEAIAETVRQAAARHREEAVALEVALSAAVAPKPKRRKPPEQAAA
jgi:hypothetical protein